MSGQTFIGDPYRPIVEAQKLEISGTFICDEQSNAEQLLRTLHSFGGISQVPIIALRYQECIHTDSTQCCQLCNPTLDWIVNYGIITGIKADSEYMNSQQQWSTSVADVQITMQVGTKWKELSRYEWDYRELKLSNPFLQAQSSALAYLPQTFEGLNKRSYFYKQSTALSKYDPTYWGVKYSTTYGGLGSDFVDMGTYEFVS